ncbi:glycosyltransferase [Schleiferiaceae bacterium]|nr:glycosyltransferase [Schleiferiaceae bacterium]
MFITIGLPFYNAEETLGDAIRSVFAQTHQDWELILLDDGSTDRSLEIAKSVKDPRVRVYSDGKNKKLASRLNEIARLAKYDYISRMDADDLIFPEKIEVQLKYLLESPEYDLIATGVYSVKNNLEIQGIRGYSYECPTFSDVVSRKSGIIHASLLVRKSWYQRNTYDEELIISQDFDLWLRAVKANDFMIKSISSPLYIYREEGNVSSEKLIRSGRITRFLLRKYAGKLKYKLVLKSYLKLIVIYVLEFSGMLHKIQKRRGNQNISVSQIEAYWAALKTIESTSVPGISDK